MNTQSGPVNTALVVDDDEFSRSTLVEMLTSLGVGRVDEADNGRIALKRLKLLPTSPDLLICDIFMPDMDGIEFLNHLIQRNHTGRVILISGMDVQMIAMARDIAASSNLNFLGAFLKPVSLDTLTEALKL